jgi:hypothetical protein
MSASLYLPLLHDLYQISSMFLRYSSTLRNRKTDVALVPSYKRCEIWKVKSELVSFAELPRCQVERPAISKVNEAVQ